MIYKYGIDFGTTNSSIAMCFVGDDDNEHTIVVDVKDTNPRVTIPSVVLIEQDGKIYAGAEAVTQYNQTAGTRKKQQFIKRIKLDLENQGDKLEYAIGNRRFKGSALIAEILKQLRLKAERMADELEIDMSGVVMGVPVEYGDIQKNVLREALVKAGYYRNLQEATARTEFVSEPIAVAVHYGLGLEQDKNIMVFDFGGGTLDVAVVKLKGQSRNGKFNPHETLAKERRTLGGEMLNKMFFVHSFCTKSKYGTDKLARIFGIRKGLAAEALWDELHKDPNGISFINKVEECKCELSKGQKCKFSFIGRGVIVPEMTFYRDDFVDAIDGILDDIDNLVDSCLEKAQIDDVYEIDHVILAGGSSMIPAIQEILTDRFGTSRVSAKLPKDDSVVQTIKRRKNNASESEVLTSIVRGLAAVGCREESQIEDVVDSDYGVWDTETNQLIKIIEKGMPVKDTMFDKITKYGKYQDVVCKDRMVPSVEVLVYQQNITGLHKLGTINIPNPGSMKYSVYMQIDKKTGMLTVTLYDIGKKRWIDEIPLSQRQYTVK